MYNHTQKLKLASVPVGKVILSMLAGENRLRIKNMDLSVSAVEELKTCPRCQKLSASEHPKIRIVKLNTLYIQLTSCTFPHISQQLYFTFTFLTWDSCTSGRGQEATDLKLQMPAGEGEGQQVKVEAATEETLYVVRT